MTTSRANLEYLPSSPLSHVHVFPYSDRPGTAASSLPDKVAGPIIRERAAPLRAIGTHLTRRFRHVTNRDRPAGADAGGRDAGRDR